MSQNLIIYIYLALSIPSIYCQDEQIGLLENERVVREFLANEHAQAPVLPQNNQYPEVQQPFSDYSIPFPAEPFIRKGDQQIETDAMVQTNSQVEHFEVSSFKTDKMCYLDVQAVYAQCCGSCSNLLLLQPPIGAAEIARIAGRLLFASVFNDLTHDAATLVAPDEQPNGQNRVAPSPNPNRLIALPQRFSESDSKRGISRTAFPHTQQFFSNNAWKRPHRAQYSIDRRQAAPRAVTPKRSHSLVSATRRITRPAPTSQPLLIPAPPPPSPQKIVHPEWNSIQAPFVDANFGQFSQANYLPAPIEKKTRLCANEKLSLFCQTRRLSSNCQAMCNSDTFTQQSLINLYLTSSYPMNEISLAFDCASPLADHTECCSRSGLAEFNGGQCMVFCRTHESKPSNALQYMGCLPVFKTIKECYREYQNDHPNIFGDFR